jgi:hypothetical protein
VRQFIFPVVEPAFFFIKRWILVASQIRLPVYLLQGKEKWSGSSLTTLFFGEEKVLPYLSDLLYSEEPVKENLGKIFVWEMKSKINLNIPKADLIFIGIDGFFSRFLSRQGFIIIPEWALFTLDLSRPFPEIWKLSKNKSLMNDLRKIRKYKYSYEMSRDPAEFGYFYRQMHLPYIAKRFGELTLPTGFRYMKRLFEKGQLLLVKRENEYISGNIIWTCNESAFFSHTAIREGKFEYLKKGVTGASYYFVILWAKGQGYKQLDFGHCRPFLNDGVFCYKKKWGMEVKRSKRLRGVIGLKVCDLHHGALEFLAKNPFIFIDQDKLKELILTLQDHPLALREVQSLFKTYYIPGVDCLVIISPKGFTQQAEEFANSHSIQKLHLINMNVDIFFKKFPHIPSLRSRNGSRNKNTEADA